MADNKQVLDMIWDSLERIEHKIDQHHTDHESRLRALEAARHEQKGMIRPFAYVLMGFLGALGGLLATWLSGEVGR